MACAKLCMNRNKNVVFSFVRNNITGPLLIRVCIRFFFYAKIIRLSINMPYVSVTMATILTTYASGEKTKCVIYGVCVDRYTPTLW